MRLKYEHDFIWLSNIQSGPWSIEAVLWGSFGRQIMSLSRMGNIAKGDAWFAMIKAGKSVETIATETGTPKRRVLQLVDLAFLSPDITIAILDGRQPVGLTSDYLIKQGFPSDWDAQRKIFATL